MLKLGNERPVASLDVNSAKLVLAQSHDIQTATLKGVGKMDDMVSLSAFELFFAEKTLMGSYYGSTDVRSDFHRKSESAGVDLAAISLRGLKIMEN